ncbi:hypothetical protein, partial [Salsipaludibacter albus]|uniref:hypothetical protein n=1 Tax=Salsipaludibacter albus TaxID=2849650 RepID=UPI001EE49C10
GIMDEPMSSVELEPNEWTDEATWPARGSRTKKLYLSGPAETGTPKPHERQVARPAGLHASEWGRGSR